MSHQVRQEGRLAALERRKHEILKVREDLDRELAEIARDQKLLREALKPQDKAPKAEVKQ